MELGWGIRQMGDRLVAAPVGRVDETTWEAFSAHLSAAVQAAASQGAPLIIDLGAV